MKIRNILSLAGALVMGVVSAATLFTACAPPPSEDVFVQEDLAAEIDANIPKDTTASIRIGIRSTNAEEEIIKGLIEEFNREYSNIDVTIVRVNGDAYDTTLISYIPAGTMPDLFWVNPNNLSMYYNSGVAFTLDNYIKESGLNTSDYVTAAMEECQSPSDHYFMMPRDYVQLVMYYNEEMMEELIAASDTVTEVPGADWTWDKFLDICQAFVETGIVEGGNPVLDVELDWEAVYYPFIRSFGGDIVDGEGNVVLDEGLNSDPDSNGAYRYLGELLRLRQSGFILSQESAVGAGTSFYGGFSPFYIHSRSSLTDAYDAFKALSTPEKDMSDKVGVLPMPAVGEDPSVSAGCTGYAIYRDSENKDAAWAFLHYMLTQGGQEALSRTGNIVPVLISEREKEDPVWKNYPEGMQVDHDMFLAHSERGIQMDFLRQLPTATHADAFSYLRTMYTSVLYSGANRVDAIQLAADRMYNLLAYGE